MAATQESTFSENITKYIAQDLHLQPLRYRRFKHKWLETAKNLYQKDRLSHTGCVNAIEFSKDGSLLFSGGDDLSVLMWNVDEEMSNPTGRIKTATALKHSHNSNIFCLDVDAHLNRVISGGNDEIALVHDYNRGTLTDAYSHHSPIRCISVAPEDPHIFVSSTDDGLLRLIDMRVGLDSTEFIAKSIYPFQSVMHHPQNSSIIASANVRQGIQLWDVREPQRPLVTCCKGPGMCVRWNNQGTLLLCVMNHHPLRLLDPTDPGHKYLELDARCYYNACTIKSCCFAGDRDQYVLSGSDDFNLYMWKIPEPWPKNCRLPEAHMTLQGHRSIVNQVRYNHERQLIASSGVEKVIKFWCPFLMPNSSGDRNESSNGRSRNICTYVFCAMRDHNRSIYERSGCVREDREMLHFFDSIVYSEITKKTSQHLLRAQPLTKRITKMIREKRLLLVKELCERAQVCPLGRTAEDLRSDLHNELAAFYEEEEAQMIAYMTRSTSTLSSSSSSSSTPPTPPSSSSSSSPPPSAASPSSSSSISIAVNQFVRDSDAESFNVSSENSSEDTEVVERNNGTRSYRVRRRRLNRRRDSSGT